MKMLRPLCNRCDRQQPQWWTTCKHDPYVGQVGHPFDVPQYEGEKDEAGNPVGTQKLVGTEKVVEWEARPNWKEVAVNDRLGSFSRVSQAQARGCIFPWEVESPVYPNGISECCQFRGCFQQKQPNGRDLIVTEFGGYCRDIEAKFAKVDQTGFSGGGKRLEVGYNAISQEKRTKQLQEMSI